MEKLRCEFPQLGLQELLDRVCVAHNELQTVDGFSPAQLVLGRNLKIPEPVSDLLTALSMGAEGDFPTQVLLMQAARSAYVSAQADRKTYRALMSTHQRIHDWQPAVGDKVYYYREGGFGKSKIRGPVNVVAVRPESKAVWIDVGGNVMSRHVSRVRRADGDLELGDVIRSTPAVDGGRSAGDGRGGGDASGGALGESQAGKVQSIVGTPVADPVADAMTDPDTDLVTNPVTVPITAPITVFAAASVTAPVAAPVTAPVAASITTHCRSGPTGAAPRAVDRAESRAS